MKIQKNIASEAGKALRAFRKHKPTKEFMQAIGKKGAEKRWEKKGA